MYKMIIGQQYFEKNKEGKFLCYKGTSEMFSEYTAKVYSELNKLLLNSRINKNLSTENSFLVSEVTLGFNSTLNEINNKEDEYLLLEDFLKNDELCNNLLNIELLFNSAIDPSFTTEEIKKIISIFKISVQKDILNLLKKEKDIEISFQI